MGLPIIITYARVSWKLVHQLRKQRRYIARHIEPLLGNASKNNDGTLREKDFSKIRNYYSLYVVAIIGECYCTLRGKPMSEKERKILTYQGALTGLYDDFFDHDARQMNPLKEMISNPLTYFPKDSVEKLFMHFVKQVYDNLEDKNLLNELAAQIFGIQSETRKQKEESLLPDELKKMSETKGGLAHLFYRVTLANPFIEKEKETLYHLGSLLQLVNDIFDVWKDCQEGISTFVNKASDIKKIKSDFEKQLQEIYHQFLTLNYNRSNKRDCFFQLMILIGMGIVCLDQYILLQENNGNRFEAKKFTRKQLVCDMDKKSNLYKLFRTCLGYDFRF